MENNRKMENDSKIGVKEYVRMKSVGCVQEPQVLKKVFISTKHLGNK